MSHDWPPIKDGELITKRSLIDCPIHFHDHIEFRARCDTIAGCVFIDAANVLNFLQVPFVQ